MAEEVGEGAVIWLISVHHSEHWCSLRLHKAWDEDASQC